MAEFMNDQSWNFFRTDGGVGSWEGFLGSRDLIRAVKGGPMAASVYFSECLAPASRELVGPRSAIEHSMVIGADGLRRELEPAPLSGAGGPGSHIPESFSWGFSGLLASLGGMRVGLEELLKTAKEPAQAAAFHQFETARHSFLQGLHAECLEALEPVISAGTPTGPSGRVEWRLHFLRGLVLMGSHDSHGQRVVNLPESEQSFLLAARHAGKSFQEDAAHAMLAAGWSAFLQSDGPGSPKLRDALTYTEEASILSPRFGEAYFQEAKIQMALGLTAEAFRALGKAGKTGAFYVAKAAADGNFKGHPTALHTFLAEFRDEQLRHLGEAVHPIAVRVRSLLPESRELSENTSAKRVLSFADGSDGAGILLLARYAELGLGEDLASLQSIAVVVRRAPPANPPGTPGDVDEPEDAPCEEVVVRRGSWFRKEIRARVTKSGAPAVLGGMAASTVASGGGLRNGDTESVDLLVDGLGVVVGRLSKAGAITIGRAGRAPVGVRWIPPGRFLMGSPDSEVGHHRVETQHEVVLTDGFLLAETPCTQSQWEAVMGGNPSEFRGDHHPVHHVTWQEAVEFCGKLTELHRTEGVLPEGRQWSLPTEAQWEYACRAGTVGAYAGEVEGMAWYGDNSRGQPHAVRTRSANAWGLYDMHGNVWEWCEDWFGGFTVASATNPKGPISGEDRVQRGGCWSVEGRECRSASRNWSAPDSRYYDLGFRPAMVRVPHGKRAR